MAVNLNRWLKYAKAKLDSSVTSGNEELDRLEAKRKAEVADKPWLAAAGDAPTVDEAAARIRWEAEQADAAAPKTSDAQSTGPAATEPAAAPTETPTPDAPTATDGSGHPPAPTAPPPAADPPPPETPAATDAAPTTLVPGPLDPADAAEAAGRANARIELEARAKESADRLEQIRRELGIDAPPGPSA